MGKVLQQRGLGDHAKAAHVSFIVLQWIEENFPQFLGDIEVESVIDGSIHIAVVHPVAEQELTLRSHELQEYVQNSTGMAVINIRISRAKRVAQDS